MSLVSKKKNKGLTFVFLSVRVTVTLSPDVLSIENILAFSIISYLFGWPLFAPKRQEITKKVQLKDTFFPRFSGVYGMVLL